MKPLLLISVIVSVVLVSLGQPRLGKKTPVIAEQNVVEMNRAWVNAFSHCDKSAFNQIIADDCIITTEYGTALSKPEFLDLMESEAPEDCKGEDLSNAEVRVQSFGSNAIITGLMSEKQDGKRVSLRYTNVFVRRNRRWTLVISQVTHVVTVTLEIAPLKPPKGL
jgi:ketosteroid isomerase-like protein